MKLVLERDVFATDFTLGKLHVLNIRQFYTCEDTMREVKGAPVSDWKIPAQTAIPVGTYKVIINWSNRFKKHLPLLLDVKGFEGIRIHSGNHKDHTEGCILVGTGRLHNGVSNSRYAMRILQDAIEAAIKRGENVTIEVRNA